VLRPSASVNLSMLLLAGAWCALALLLGTLLPVPPEDRVESTTLWQGESVIRLRFSDPNPCTSQSAALDASVSIHAETVARDDEIRVDVEAIFGNTVETIAVDRLMPRRELFIDRISTATQFVTSGAMYRYVHRVEVPLADRLRGSHLVVDLVSSIARDGHVSVEPLETRLECDSR
jgi:hypothetical protein